MKTNVKCFTESAVMLALGTALSFICFPGIWVMGGSVTAGCLVPMVILCCKYGTKYGLCVCSVFGLIQMLCGFSNVQYAPNALMVILIVLFDYVVAYGVIGLSAVFYGKRKSRMSLVAGVALSCGLRFVCHFITGWVVWDSLWPNTLGMISPVYSFVYNISYMLPETVITCAVSAILIKPLKKYL